MSRRPPEDIDPFEPTDFVDSAPVPADELGPGALVGDYRIEGKIGEGGMGIVFAAVHPVIGKRAAIKVLKRELCTDRTELARFIDEARAVNKIGHPNIVDIFTLGQLADGRSYLVMEWLAGQTLRARLRQGRPDLEETCYVLRALARALDAAHEKGIVHRDLKPDNVFLVEVRGDRPLVKLLDFGIAKLMHAEQRIERTATNQMIGTPLYIAPEQARAEPIDHRADVYALGAMAFELITGTPPFGGKSAMEVIAKHMLEKAPRVSSLVQGVPAELDDVIAAMLDKEPAHRPSLAELAGILDRLGPMLRAYEVRDRTAAPPSRETAYTMSPNTPSYAPSVAMAATPAPSGSLAGSALVSAAPMMSTAPAGAVSMSPGLSMPMPMPGSVTFDAPPALAMTTPGAPRRRWLVPVLAGACGVIGLVVAFVLVRGNDETKPARPAPATAPSVKPDPDPVKVAPATSDVKPEPPKPEPKPEPLKEPPKPAPPKAEPVTPEPVKVEPVKPEPRPRVRPRPRPRPGGGEEEEELLAPGSIPRRSRR